MRLMKTKLLIAFLAFATTANAQYTKLLDFAGTTNGNNPEGSLMYDGTFLYGMTHSGGTYDAGTIFKIMPDGTGYVKLKDFGSSTNGEYPYGSLVSDGTFLYGMTMLCSTNCSGSIFKMKPDGTGYVTLHSFTGTPDGGYPLGSLISDGTFLYGMTQTGGMYGGCNLNNGCGCIFKIKSDGTGYIKLHDFENSNSTDGSQPFGSLISDGTFLYGMTAYGGASGSGTIFKIKPDGTGYASLYASGNSHGSLISDGSFLYGMSYTGGISNPGTVFKIKPDGTGYLQVHSFGGLTEGYKPVGSLVSDGTFLYGMTREGGTNNCVSATCGTVFKVKPDGTRYVKLLDFTGTLNGNFPNGDFVLVGNFLYGMTSQGGANDLGTLFRLGLSAAGITENNKSTEVNIFPNPFCIQTTLRANENLENATLIVCNSVGQQVKQIKNISGHAVSLFRDNLPSGIYYIRLTQDNKTFAIGKLVIIN
jgi:uncharacterized repeat protein (TIGR03803 family)